MISSVTLLNDSGLNCCGLEDLNFAINICTKKDRKVNHLKVDAHSIIEL